MHEWCPLYRDSVFPSVHINMALNVCFVFMRIISRETLPGLSGVFLGRIYRMDLVPPGSILSGVILPGDVVVGGGEEGSKVFFRWRCVVGDSRIKKFRFCLFFLCRFLWRCLQFTFIIERPIVIYDSCKKNLNELRNDFLSPVEDIPDLISC